ncbi:hypothetical protein AVEN_244751-1 [Araneus ventricosus]|uniref:Uncharacterized protein n=1 Tax=Araneus ventricosus TaxID=182803 RepID=A0A4Y2BSV4_ARAVE|nr:hypothetical protein AVEN_244751-1 [Araneus ventricosus]
MLGRMQRKLWLICSINELGNAVPSTIFPGLKPCDIDFIPNMKEPFRGIRFRTVPEILQAVDAPFEQSTQQALLKVSYNLHIGGNGLYTMLVTTLKGSKTW